MLHKDPKNVTTDADIERVKRAHMNDLENIPLFCIIGALYVLTDPNAWTAKMIFLAFTVARVGHTVSYLNALQPHRALCFGVGMMANIYMSVNVMLSCL